jgi:FixJ family two-component response regulator
LPVQSRGPTTVTKVSLMARAPAQHVANGQKNRDIADKLCISELTVEAHLKSILQKLGADDRTRDARLVDARPRQVERPREISECR